MFNRNCNLLHNTPSPTACFVYQPLVLHFQEKFITLCDVKGLNTEQVKNIQRVYAFTSNDKRIPKFVLRLKRRRVDTRQTTMRRRWRDGRCIIRSIWQPALFFSFRQNYCIDSNLYSFVPTNKLKFIFFFPGAPEFYKHNSFRVHVAIVTFCAFRRVQFSIVRGATRVPVPTRAVPPISLQQDFFIMIHRD